MVDEFKSYEFDVQLGVETTTLDFEGTPIKHACYKHISENSVIEALEGFKGSIDQIPPMHSAIKWKGKPLYEYARREKISQVEMEQFQRKVYIQDITMLHCRPPMMTFRVTCSKGTYIRCLGRDLAYRLGTVGSITRLQRTFASGFSLQQCRSLEMIEQTIEAGQRAEECKILLKNMIVPMHRLKLSIPFLHVCSDYSQRLLYGQIIKIQDQNAFDALINGDYSGGIQQTDQDKAELRGFFAEKGFPKTAAMVVLSEGSRAIGIASASVLQNGQMTLKLRRGL